MKAALIIVGGGLCGVAGYAGGKWVGGAHPTFLKIGSFEAGPVVVALGAGLVVGAVAYFAQDAAK